MDKIINEMHSHPIAIKIRAEHGCFCRSHSRETNRLIDEIVLNHNTNEFDYREHESGPEIVAGWLLVQQD